MDEAERAYRASVAQIEQVRAEGGTVLFFDAKVFRALDRIPDRIADLPGLTRLDLDNTRVADLTPIASLTALQSLWLDNTRVADLTPIASLTALRELRLDNTQIADLRPIRDLAELGTVGGSGLDFKGTPFAEATEETRRLAAIRDRQERTRETLAFLKTLPPWPEPLPWEVEATPEPEPEPEPDPAVPLATTPAGIALAGKVLSPDELDDPIRPILFETLRARADELVRLGNRDEMAWQVGTRLQPLLANGLGAMVPLSVHLEIEALRRFVEDPAEQIEPEVRRLMAEVLDVGPGLTLDTPQVQLWIDRVRRNRLQVLASEQVEAEIRLARQIAASDLTAPNLQKTATLAADPKRDDQFTAIRSALDRNFVIEVVRWNVALAATTTVQHYYVTGQVGWLAANAADILIAARGWGAPYLAWIAPILDRAQTLVAGAAKVRPMLRDGQVGPLP